MQYLYRSKTKYRKLEKTIRLIILIFLIVTALIFSVKAQLNGNAGGEYGVIGSDISTSEEVGESDPAGHSEDKPGSESITDSSGLLASVPEYSGTPTYVINGNKPTFTESEYKRAEEAFIDLSPLDSLGRCGTCTASLGKEMLDSAGERRDISQYHPSGWKQASYPDVIEAEGGWLFHRAHLIAHMFAGADPEIDAERNLITGTEYCNENMLPYAERAVQGWLLKKANGTRVLYRVTPVFSGKELVARGVHIEAADVPTQGKDFHINVYCYNVEPGIEIDYATGRSWRS